jgi:hypothetical protein
MSKVITGLSKRGIRNGGLLFRDNTVDAFNVQLWANESLAVLIENMVMGNLVYRDYDPLIAKYGDTVNVRKPGQFNAKRKTNADAVTIQNVTATTIPVKLDQQIHVSYLIKDGEESIAFMSIIDEFLRPAMIANAQFIDHVLSCQVYQFLGNSTGRLGAMDTTNAKRFILDARAEMNANKAWTTDRNLVLTSQAESIMLDVELFTDASKVGDDGTALREASLGRKLGFDTFMAQNQPYVTGQTTINGAINLAAGYPAGATSIVVSGFSAALTAGTWFTVDGDDTPQQVVSTVGGAAPTTIVMSPGLRRPIVNSAVVRVYPKGAVSATYTYDSTTHLGYAKELTVSGFTVAPQVGQLVSFGSDTSIAYGIIEVNGLVGIVLDRPLEATVSSGSTVNLGPSGSYNFALHPTAVALVSRPMAAPRRGTGALSAVVEYNGLSIRVVITYDGNKQGHLVTLDILAGVKKLDDALGAVLLS